VSANPGKIPSSNPSPSRARQARWGHRRGLFDRIEVDGETWYRARCRCGWVAAEARSRKFLADLDYREHRPPTW